MRVTAIAGFTVYIYSNQTTEKSDRGNKQFISQIFQCTRIQNLHSSNE